MASGWRRPVVIIFSAATLLLAGCTASENTFSTAPSLVATGSALPTIGSVAGTWSGSYRVVECTQRDGGPLANICTSLGVAYPFTLDLQQHGPVVSGRFALASVWFDLSPGQIVDDRVTVRGTGRLDNAGVEIDVTWALSIAHPVLGGTALMEWAADAGGGATMRATLVGQVSGG